MVALSCLCAPPLHAGLHRDRAAFGTRGPRPGLRPPRPPRSAASHGAGGTCRRAPFRPRQQRRRGDRTRAWRARRTLHARRALATRVPVPAAAARTALSRARRQRRGARRDFESARRNQAPISTQRPSCSPASTSSTGERRLSRRTRGPSPPNRATRPRFSRWPTSTKSGEISRLRRARYERALTLADPPRRIGRQTLRTLGARARREDWTAPRALHRELVKLEPTSLFVKGELGRDLYARGEVMRAEVELKDVVARGRGRQPGCRPGAERARTRAGQGARGPGGAGDAQEGARRGRRGDGASGGDLRDRDRNLPCRSAAPSTRQAVGGRAPERLRSSRVAGRPVLGDGRQRQSDRDLQARPGAQPAAGRSQASDDTALAGERRSRQSHRRVRGTDPRRPQQSPVRLSRM